jgi:D-galacturonate reductase
MEEQNPKRIKVDHAMAGKKLDVLMVGTGEYTTGYVGGTASDSDKGAGVVALTMFDLRRRGKVDRVGMCGVNVRISV